MGLTGIHDAGVGSSTIDRYKRFIDEDRFTVRMYAMVGGPGETFETYCGNPLLDYGDRLTVRSVKLVLDGALGSRGAVTSGAPVCMVPLEVTHTALVTKQVMQKILTPPDHPFLKLIAELLLFFADTYKKVFKFEDGPPLHDPVAVAYAIAPEIFVVEKLHVEVERCSPLSSGQTIVDVWGRSGLQPNATVCKSVDVDAFWELLINAVRDAAAVVSTPLTPPNPLA